MKKHREQDIQSELLDLLTWLSMSNEHDIAEDEIQEILEDYNFYKDDSLECSLTFEAERELQKLTPEQKTIVLKGLNAKLRHYEKSGELSYRYDICPVCNDMNSTEENPKCDGCYIKISCQAPFERGFKEDKEKGYEYFNEMREFLNLCQIK